MATHEGRVPPHNLDAEAAVLGAILLDNEALGELETKLDYGQAFYKDTHRKIFKAMLEVIREGTPVDLITISERLAVLGELENIGGFTVLVGLSESSPTAAYVGHYSDIVAEKYQSRRLIAACGEGMKLAFDEEPNAVDRANQLVSSVAVSQQARDYATAPELTKSAVEYARQMIDNKRNGRTFGISTGLKELDYMIGGFERGALYIVAARPAMGKSALMLDFLRDASAKGISTGLFSMEMSSVSLMSRMVAQESRVDSKRVRDGTMTDSELHRYVQAAERLSGARICMSDVSSLSINELRAQARRMKAREGIDLLAIDYLQLMSGAGDEKGGENRQQEISRISRGLKTLARELDIPIIALSQLSRAVEARPNKRPMLSDLRESGSLEQDADAVMFIYRDDYYNPMSEQPGVAEIILGKQRSGPIGTVKATWLAHCTSFRNYADDV